MTLWADAGRNDAKALIAFLLKPGTILFGLGNTATDLAIRELGYSARPPLQYHDVQEVLKDLNELPAGSDTVAAFESAFARRKAQATKVRVADIRWAFFWPLRTQLADTLTEQPRMRVLGTTFRFCRTETISRALGRSSLEAESLRNLLQTRELEVPPVFLAASMKAGDAWEAWVRLTPAFDTIRGLMEYGFGFGARQLSFGEPSSRSAVPHPDWMLIKGSGRPLEGLRFMTEPGARSRTTLNSARLNVVHRLARELRDKPLPGSTIALIADGLRLYAQAMDDRHRYAAFLGLWQLGERITLSDSVGGDTARVCQRLAWLVQHSFKIPGSGLRHLLATCAAKRNAIVHAGMRGDVEDDDVNTLKLIVERALLWIIEQHRRLRHQADLAVLYQMSTLPAKYIDAHAGAARFLLAVRANALSKENAPSDKDDRSGWPERNSKGVRLRL